MHRHRSLFSAAGVAESRQAANSQVHDPVQATRETWGQTMKRLKPPGLGCFHASYPGTRWESVTCKPAPSHPVPGPAVKAGRAAGKQVGAGTDWVLAAPSLIQSAIGTFPLVHNVTSIGDPQNQPNDYSIQLNTNSDGTTRICAGMPGCTVWQQFVYEAGEYSALYMQYWVFNFVSTSCQSSATVSCPPLANCPAGFNQVGDAPACWRNSKAARVGGGIPLAALQELELIGQAGSGGAPDSVVLITPDRDAYSVTADSVMDIASVWRSAEFSIFGGYSGNEAIFNRGSYVAVRIGATYNGSDSVPPKCEANAGTTAETNNLTLGRCSARPANTNSLSYPFIEFTEAN